VTIGATAPHIVADPHETESRSLVARSVFWSDHAEPFHARISGGPLGWPPKPTATQSSLDTHDTLVRSPPTPPIDCCVHTDPFHRSISGTASVVPPPGVLSPTAMQAAGAGQAIPLSCALPADAGGLGLWTVHRSPLYSSASGSGFSPPL
jgi:hypothetical protein